MVEICSRCSQCPCPFPFGPPRGHREVREQLVMHLQLLASRSAVFESFSKLQGHTQPSPHPQNPQLRMEAWWKELLHPLPWWHVFCTLPQRVSSSTELWLLTMEIAVILYLLCLPSSLLLTFQRKTSCIQISLSDSAIWKDLKEDKYLKIFPDF